MNKPLLLAVLLVAVVIAFNVMRFSPKEEPRDPVPSSPPSTNHNPSPTSSQLMLDDDWHRFSRNKVERPTAAPVEALPSLAPLEKEVEQSPQVDLARTSDDTPLPPPLSTVAATTPPLPGLETAPREDISTTALPSPPPPPPATTAQSTAPQLKKKRLLIIGGAGYVGSGLGELLRHTYEVSLTDRNRRAALLPNVVRRQARDVPAEELRAADVVVYLGGLTGREACDAQPYTTVREENVDDLLALIQRMLPTQLLLFASTSAIGEGHQVPVFRESDAPELALFDSYTKSLWEREQAVRQLVAGAAPQTLPTMVAMRFGTIIGVSPSQRTQFVHVAMVRSALLQGRITVTHPETQRSYLSLRDLARAVDAMIRSPQLLPAPFSIFHLVSFSASIGQAANEIASLTGVPVTLRDHAPKPDVKGFRLSNDLFRATFGFEFETRQADAIAELLAHADHIKVAREILDRGPQPAGHKCRVCGSTDLHEVLNLGDQALANDFRATAAEAQRCEKYPLRLDRCRRCHHAQLSATVVDRKDLFTNYSYRSGTSKTLDRYFEWLAARVDGEVRKQRPASSEPAAALKVLEIACNDGSQLNHFKRLGWETYGADPAANLVVYAKASGHVVGTGLWGAGDAAAFAMLPEKVDAVVAQNVLAHVPDPTSFLAACVEKMHDRTLMYMQTSQCEMFSNGQFDTIYHEHLSFFSPSSFLALASKLGLRIVRFEVTPIHGGSCFVTMVKEASPIASDGTLPLAVAADERRGLTTDAFYVSYRARVLAMRQWIVSTLESAAQQPRTSIIGYGAAAKGMVLLLHMLELKPKFRMEYVVDDAPLKQGTYCPGTDIPVKPTSHITEHACEQDLVIVVFSWNFWAEIRERIVKAVRAGEAQCSERKAVWVVVPFPEQRLVYLPIPRAGEAAPKKVEEEDTVALENPYEPLDVANSSVIPASLVAVPAATSRPPAPPRKKVALITYFQNDERLLPYFISHHAPLFDRVVLIDQGSVDGSRNILQRYAPSSWVVVPMRGDAADQKQAAADVPPPPPLSDAAPKKTPLDAEIEHWEQQFPNWWKVSFPLLEFLTLRRGLRSVLRDADAPRELLLHVVEMSAVDRNHTTALAAWTPLVEQRFAYRLGNRTASATTTTIRVIHDGSSAGRYYAGGAFLTNGSAGLQPFPDEGGLLRYHSADFASDAAAAAASGDAMASDSQSYGGSLNDVFGRCESDAARTRANAMHRAWYAVSRGRITLRHNC